jgi:predicted metalloprotease with PDZ domain
LRLNEAPGSGVHVKAVSAGSAAMAAGVAAGDELLAVNGWRIRRLDEAVQWLKPGSAFELLLARDQRLHTVAVQPGAGVQGSALTLAPQPTTAAAKRRRGWLSA